MTSLGGTYEQFVADKPRDSGDTSQGRVPARCVPVVLGVAPMALVLGAQAAQKGLTLAGSAREIFRESKPKGAFDGTLWHLCE